MKKSVLILAGILAFTSCHESLEDRAAREAREYTEKFCPTPVENFTRTDSIVFEKATRTYHYYCTLSGKMDNADIISQNKVTLHTQLARSLAQSTNIRAYKDAGFNFAYTCRSESNPKVILYEDVFTRKDYQ